MLWVTGIAHPGLQGIGTSRRKIGAVGEGIVIGAAGRDDGIDRLCHYAASVDAIVHVERSAGGDRSKVLQLDPDRNAAAESGRREQASRAEPYGRVDGVIIIQGCQVTASAGGAGGDDIDG